MKATCQRIFAGFVLLTTLVPSQAHALTQFFNDRATFEAALAPGYFLENFNSLTPFASLPSPQSFAGSGFSFDASATGFFNPSFPFTPYPYTPISSTVLGTTDSAQPITFTFGPGVRAFGGDFFASNFAGDAISPSTLEVEIFSSSGFEGSSSWGNVTTLQFVGFITDVDLISASFNPDASNAYNPATTPCDDAIPNCIFASAEDVTIGTTTSTTASVPGPLPFLGVAAAFGYSRRLKKRIQGVKNGPVVFQFQ